MSVPNQVIRSLVAEGARVNIHVPGRTGLGDAKFELSDGGRVLLCKVTLLDHWGVLPSDSRTPQNWIKGEVLPEYKLDPNRIKNRGPSTSWATLHTDLEDGVMYMHPKGEDPDFLLYQEAQRQKNALQHHPAS